MPDRLGLAIYIGRPSTAVHSFTQTISLPVLAGTSPTFQKISQSKAADTIFIDVDLWFLVLSMTTAQDRWRPYLCWIP